MAAATSKRKSRGGGKAAKAKGGDGKIKTSKPEPAMDGSGSDSEDGGLKLTLEALEAMSDESGDDEGAGGDDGEEGNDNEDYGAEAEALKAMIREGKFDGLLKDAAKKKKRGGAKPAAEEAEIEEGSESGSDSDSESGSDDDMEEALAALSPAEVKQLLQAPDEEGDDGMGDESESNGSEESEDETEYKPKPQQTTQALALSTAVQAADRHLPWAETFAVVPPAPLPFRPPGVHPPNNAATDEEDDEFVDVHDDLRREVAFHDLALASALSARERCEHLNIPFARPDDFFAEMVKSDAHMAKIKDRLIFETKKMEAVDRRKSNKEHTVMAKERRAHRAAEKAKAKKAHLQGVEEWRRSAQNERGGLGGRVRDADDDEARLQGMNSGQKRKAADRKFGFGGKRGRFKQNDPKDLNDMRGYGAWAKKGKGGGGKKRPGKRARDAGKR
ncbi:hypothetical protein ACHAXT_011271 [Thalassiosira profunda]